MISYEKLFFESLFIRRVEEKIIELYPKDKIQSPVHLSIGQEAIAVGLCQNLKKTDVIFPNYRGHSYYLAKGAPLSKFFAELYGKKTGISKGKAGSMHLSSPKHGVMGSSAVVASTISHAVGFAFANKIKGMKNITISIFGDGATEQGVLYESMNFASLYKLPIIFLCENNSLAVHSFLKDRQSYSIIDIPKLFKIDSYSILNGYDISHVFDHFNDILSSFKKNPRPIFVEAQTYRYKEHVGPNDDFNFQYRSFTDFQKWLNKDPLNKDITLIKKYDREIKLKIDRAINFAEKSNFPKADELLKDVI